MSKWDASNLKAFAQPRKTATNKKKKPTEWENILTNIFNKVLTSKICKEFTKLNTKKAQTNKKQTNPNLI